MNNPVTARGFFFYKNFLPIIIQIRLTVFVFFPIIQTFTEFKMLEGWVRKMYVSIYVLFKNTSMATTKFLSVCPMSVN